MDVRGDTITARPPTVSPLSSSSSSLDSPDPLLSLSPQTAPIPPFFPPSPSPSSVLSLDLYFTSLLHFTLHFQIKQSLFKIVLGNMVCTTVSGVIYSLCVDLFIAGRRPYDPEDGMRISEGKEESWKGRI